MTGKRVQFIWSTAAGSHRVAFSFRTSTLQDPRCHIKTLPTLVKVHRVTSATTYRCWGQTEWKWAKSLYGPISSALFFLESCSCTLNKVCMRDVYVRIHVCPHISDGCLICVSTATKLRNVNQICTANVCNLYINWCFEGEHIFHQSQNVTFWELVKKKKENVLNFVEFLRSCSKNLPHLLGTPLWEQLKASNLVHFL